MASKAAYKSVKQVSNTGLNPNREGLRIPPNMWEFIGVLVEKYREKLELFMGDLGRGNFTWESNRCVWLDYLVGGQGPVS